MTGRTEQEDSDWNSGQSGQEFASHKYRMGWIVTTVLPKEKLNSLLLGRFTVLIRNFHGSLT